MAIKRGNSKDAFEEQETFDVVWYQQQMRTLQGTIDMLQGELESMRQQQRAVYVKDLESRLYEMQRELMTAHRRNKKLTGTLQEAKEKLQILKEKVASLAHRRITMGFSSARMKTGPSISISVAENGASILTPGSRNKLSRSDKKSLLIVV